MSRSPHYTPHSTLRSLVKNYALICGFIFRDRSYHFGLTLPWACPSYCHDRQYFSNEYCVYINEIEPEENADNCCGCRANWIWIDGSSLTFTSWEYFKPSGNNFAVLRFNSRAFVWDNTENEENYFVCKRTMDYQDTTITPPTASPQGKQKYLFE